VEDDGGLADSALDVADFATYGAAIGSFVPGVGTVVGAGVGAGVGVANEAYEYFTKPDDVESSYQKREEAEKEQLKTWTNEFARIYGEKKEVKNEDGSITTSYKYDSSMHKEGDPTLTEFMNHKQYVASNTGGPEKTWQELSKDVANFKKTMNVSGDSETSEEVSPEIKKMLDLDVPDKISYQEVGGEVSVVDPKTNRVSSTQRRLNKLREEAKWSSEFVHLYGEKTTVENPDGTTTDTYKYDDSMRKEGDPSFFEFKMKKKQEAYLKRKEERGDTEKARTSGEKLEGVVKSPLMNIEDAVLPNRPVLDKTITTKSFSDKVNNSKKEIVKVVGGTESGIENGIESIPLTPDSLGNLPSPTSKTVEPKEKLENNVQVNTYITGTDYRVEAKVNAEEITDTGKSLKAGK